MWFSDYRLYSNSHPEPDEVEALQSDVMRFMAILGICLMVIFALVQSLPSSGIPPVAPEELLKKHEEIKALQQSSAIMQDQITELENERQDIYNELDSMQSTLVNLTAELKKTEQEMAQMSTEQRQSKTVQQDLQQLLQKIDQAEKKYQEQISKTEKTSSKLQILEKSIIKRTVVLDSLTRQVKEHVSRLAAIQNQDAARQKTLKELRQQIQANMEARRALAAQQARPVKKQTEKPVPAPIAAPVPVPKEQVKEREGFVLRFSSDSSLDRLINEKKVQLYVRSSATNYRLEQKGRKRAFVKSPSPGQFYEMHISTVPSNYRKLLFRSIGRTGSGIPTWGVTLPESIRGEIQKAMQGHKGGELVIDARGHVKLI